MNLLTRSCVVVVVGILLGACNMVISDAPMFAEAERGTIAPRNGVWVNDDAGCQFESSGPERDWPECAMWVVVRGSGDEFWLMDGKGQAEQTDGLFAVGDPTIFQARWVDTAKDSKSYFGYFGVEPGSVGSDKRFSTASMWGIQCGIQAKGSSEIQPFPGITAECRPTSRDAIRSAAMLSRRADEIKNWRWLRAEASKN